MAGRVGRLGKEVDGCGRWLNTDPPWQQVVSGVVDPLSVPENG